MDFDGFVVDWMIQDRINTAKRQVEEATNGKYRQSITAYVKRMAMNQKWFIAIRALWIISIFLFLHLEVQD